MIAEFESEDVLDTINRPSLDKLKAKGYAVLCCEVAPQKVFDEFDGDTNTSTKIHLYAFLLQPRIPGAELQGYKCSMAQTGNDIS